MGEPVLHHMGEHLERVDSGNPEAIPNLLVKSNVFTLLLPQTRGRMAVWVLGWREDL